MPRHSKPRLHETNAPELFMIPAGHPWLEERAARVAALEQQIGEELRRRGLIVAKARERKLYPITCCRCGRVRELTPHQYHGRSKNTRRYCSHLCHNKAVAEERRAKKAG